MRKDRSEKKQPLKVPIAKVTIKAASEDIQWMPRVEADLRSALRVKQFELTTGDPREIVVTGYAPIEPSA